LPRPKQTNQQTQLSKLKYISRRFPLGKTRPRTNTYTWMCVYFRNKWKQFDSWFCTRCLYKKGKKCAM